MRLVFGWNNFKIKSYTPRELNLTKEDTQEFRVEVRQSYFHLFWIPFFGLGKKWAIRKGKDLYEVPGQYMQLIRSQQIRVRTPWYTFTGPLLIVAGLLIWQGLEYKEEADSRKRAQQRIERKAAGLDNALANLNDHYFLKLKKISVTEYDKYIHFKVEQLKGDSVEIAFINTGMHDYQELPIHVEQFYRQYKERLLHYTIHKKDLAASIIRNRKELNAYTTTGIALLSGDSTRFTLEEAEIYFRPILRDQGTGSYGGADGHLSMQFQNLGWPATITVLKTISGNLNWSSTTPINFPGAGRNSSPSVYLSAKGYKQGDPYTFLMELTDSSGAKYTYKVEGVNLSKKITAL